MFPSATGGVGGTGRGVGESSPVESSRGIWPLAPRTTALGSLRPSCTRSLRRDSQRPGAVVDLNSGHSYSQVACSRRDQIQSALGDSCDWQALD